MNREFCIPFTDAKSRYYYVWEAQIQSHQKPIVITSCSSGDEHIDKSVTVMYNAHTGHKHRPEEQNYLSLSQSIWEVVSVQLSWKFHQMHKFQGHKVAIKSSCYGSYIQYQTVHHCFDMNYVWKLAVEYPRSTSTKPSPGKWNRYTSFKNSVQNNSTQAAFFTT